MRSNENLFLGHIVQSLFFNLISYLWLLPHSHSLLISKQTNQDYSIIYFIILNKQESYLHNFMYVSYYHIALISSIQETEALPRFFLGGTPEHLRTKRPPRGVRGVAAPRMARKFKMFKVLEKESIRKWIHQEKPIF